MGWFDHTRIVLCVFWIDEWENWVLGCDLGGSGIEGRWEGVYIGSLLGERVVDEGGDEGEEEGEGELGEVEVEGDKFEIGLEIIVRKNPIIHFSYHKNSSCHIHFSKCI